MRSAVSVQLLYCFLVTILVEFFCDRLKDHFSVIPHVVSGLLALVGYQWFEMLFNSEIVYHELEIIF